MHYPSFRYAALVIAGEVPGVGTGGDGWLCAGVRPAALAVRLQLLPVRAAAPGLGAGSRG